MNIWLIVVISFLVGILANELLRHLQKAYGVLKVDHSDPERDRYLLEIEDLANLDRKRFIVLKIDNDADLSHK